MNFIFSSFSRNLFNTDREAGAEYCVHGPEDARLARWQCSALSGKGERMTEDGIWGIIK
jgi:hypothetical protein